MFVIYKFTNDPFMKVKSVKYTDDKFLCIKDLYTQQTLLETSPCKAKVANYWNTFVVNEDVGWLQVSVHYVARVKELY